MTTTGEIGQDSPTPRTGRRRSGSYVPGPSELTNSSSLTYLSLDEST